MAYPLPSHDPNFYHETQADSAHNHVPQKQEGLELLEDTSSSRAYPTSGSVIVSNPAGSSADQSDITALFGFRGSVSTFSEASEPFLPLPNPFFTPNNPFGNQIVSSNSLVLRPGPDTSFPTAWETGGIFPMALDSNGYLPMEFDNLEPMPGVTHQTLPSANGPADLAGFGNLDNSGVVDQEPLAAPNETWLLFNPELLNHDHSGTIDTDASINPILHQQHGAENNNLPLAVTMPQEYSNMTSSNANFASFDVGLLFQNMPHWDWGLPEHIASLPLLPPMNIQPLETQSRLKDVVSAERDAVLHDVAPSGLAPVREERAHGLRPIRAKLVTPPLDTIIDLDRNSVTKRLRGRDRGSHLDAETKKGAAFMRIKQACSPCFVNNVKCSMHDICTRCLNLPRSPFQGITCHRGHLQDYFDVFLPPFLIEHLHQVAIDQFNGNLRFTNDEYVAYLSTGRTHPPIIVLVSKIIPPDDEFLMVADLTQESNDHMKSFATVQSLQYAMRNYSIEQVKQKCRDHVEAIIKPENLIGDRSTLRCKLLLAICRFLEAIPVSKENNLLRNAVMMNRIQYVMGRNIVVQCDSALNTGSGLDYQSDSHPVSPMSARALTRQMKAIMNLLLKDLTSPVLEELDRQLRKKRTEHMPICLCTFLVLCMSAEELQVAIDAFVLFKSSHKSSSGDGDPNHIFQRGTEACAKLEKEMLEHSWILLNTIMKRILKIHNPFRYRGEPQHEPDQIDAKENLMKDIRRLLVDHEDEIASQSSDDYYGGSSRLVADHKTFRRRNFGRLISKALGELR